MTCDAPGAMRSARHCTMAGLRPALVRALRALRPLRPLPAALVALGVLGAQGALCALCALGALGAQPAQGAEAARTPRGASASAATRAQASSTYRGHDAARAFAAEVAARHQLPRGWVQRQLDAARRQESVRRLIMPPPAGTAKNWTAYLGRFVEPSRVAAGAAFWQAHAQALGEAEARWGVPAELVVGIIGVETFYGRFTGIHRVIDALATLSFDFPPGRKDRSAFFRGELEEFLLWCRRERVDCTQVKGSYAGAMGLPQFMPGSLNRHALDFDGDGRVDLQRSAADAIGSVANYMARHGWQRGMPTHFAVKAPVDTADRAALLGPDILPSFSGAQFSERGAVLDADGAAHGGALALIELQNGDAAPSYVAGTQNFYALTRYNWSAYYAMAVISLGQAVRSARSGAPARGVDTRAAPGAGAQSGS